MAAYFFSQNYDGMAKWMMVQKDEELFHAQKFFDHISNRGGFAKILGLGEPKHKWDSPLAVFKDSYKHEQFITARINELVKLAQKENDYAAFEFLQWFVREQIEEENNTSKAAQTLERIGNSTDGLVMVDKELGLRPPFTPPAPGTADA